MCDRQADKIAISISRVNVLTCIKNATYFVYNGFIALELMLSSNGRVTLPLQFSR